MGLSSRAGKALVPSRTYALVTARRPSRARWFTCAGWSGARQSTSDRSLAMATPGSFTRQSPGLQDRSSRRSSARTESAAKSEACGAGLIAPICEMPSFRKPCTFWTASMKTSRGTSTRTAPSAAVSAVPFAPTISPPRVFTIASPRASLRSSAAVKPRLARNSGTLSAHADAPRHDRQPAPRNARARKRMPVNASSPSPVAAAAGRGRSARVSRTAPVRSRA